VTYPRGLPRAAGHRRRDLQLPRWTTWLFRTPRTAPRDAGAEGRSARNDWHFSAGGHFRGNQRSARAADATLADHRRVS